MWLLFFCAAVRSAADEDVGSVVEIRVQAATDRFSLVLLDVTRRGTAVKACFLFSATQAGR